MRRLAPASWDLLLARYTRSIRSSDAPTGPFWSGIFGQQHTNPARRLVISPASSGMRLGHAVRRALLSAREPFDVAPIGRLPVFRTAPAMQRRGLAIAHIVDRNIAVVVG